MDWTKVIELMGNKTEQSLDAVGLMNITVNLFQDASTPEEAINILNNKTNYQKILRTEEGEYVFVLEILKNSVIEDIDYKYVIHANTALVNQNARFTNSILADTFSKVNIDVDIYSIVTELYKISEYIENNNCDEQFYKYFNYYDYTWYDPRDLTVILKRAYAVKIKKGDREFLIASGFTLSDIPTNIKNENEKRVKTRWIVFFSTLVIWILFFWFFYRYGKNSNWKKWTASLLLGILVSFITAYGYTTPSSYVREQLEANQLKGRLLTIGSISLGLSILFSNTFKQYKEFTDNQIILLIISAFVFTLLALILPVFQKTGQGVRLINTVQRSFLAIAIGLVVYAMGTVFINIPL